MKTQSKTILIVVLLPLLVFAQQKTQPFRINLLHGYHLRQTQGIDTRTGEFSKFGGLLIRYDMGGDIIAGKNVKPVKQWRRQCAWREDAASEPKDDTGDVLCWIDADESKHEETLYVWFPDFTEFWTRVKNQRQIDVVLKMLLTYDPDIQPKS
jgi:hypothetical protein